MSALAEELQGQVEIHIVEADLTTTEGVARTMEAIRQKGPLDYLINNAGFSTLGNFEGELIDSQHAMVNLHINATLSLCRAAIPFMREIGGGNIVNVSSIGAFAPFAGVAVYSATKAFLNSFSISLQAELAGSGITVQALCPGYTRTEIHDTATMGRFDKSVVPDEYWMEADEVVSTCLQGLEGGPTVLVTGAGNLAMAKKGLSKQLEAL